MSQKLINSQNETNLQQQRMADVAEKKVALVDQQVEIMEGKVLAMERQAAAAEYLSILKGRKLHQQWSNNMHILRMNKLKYL